MFVYCIYIYIYLDHAVYGLGCIKSIGMFQGPKDVDSSLFATIDIRSFRKGKIHKIVAPTFQPWQTGAANKLLIFLVLADEQWTKPVKPLPFEVLT